LLFIYLLYNRTQGTTKLKSKCTIQLICVQPDLTYSKLTRNWGRPTQYPVEVPHLWASQAD